MSERYPVSGADLQTPEISCPVGKVPLTVIYDRENSSLHVVSPDGVRITRAVENLGQAASSAQVEITHGCVRRKCFKNGCYLESGKS